MLRKGPRVATCTDKKKIEISGTIKCRSQRFRGQPGDVGDRPRPYTVGKTEQRAAVRHPLKSKSAVAIRID
jgi:hypothetical protein